MPPPELTARTQNCVLWPFVSFDDHGRYRVGDPVDIVVRWQETRREIRKPDGILVAIEATAYVDREIVPDSLIWLGTVDDLPPGTGGTYPDNLKQVVTYEDVPDLKGRQHRRTVTLARYHAGPVNSA
jgi:hypothetical protein